MSASLSFTLRALGVLCVTLGGCATILPTEPARRALVRDMERIVDSEQQIKGWAVDDAEVRDVINDAMLSVCRVPLDERIEALAWLDLEIARLGGPVAKAWRLHGKKISAVSELVLITRTKALLEEAKRWADNGKCPFWIEPSDHFDGRQGFEHRLLFDAEGGGRFSVGVEKTGDQRAVVGLGAGGAGRFLAGYGITDSLMVLIGGETALGARLSAPGAVVITTAGLIVARINLIPCYLEFETGPLGYFDETTGEQQIGFHGAVGIGTTALRSFGGFVSGSILSVSEDYTFGEAVGGVARTNLLTLGVRATYAISR